MKKSLLQSFRGGTLLATTFSVALVGMMSGVVFFVTSNNMRAARRNADRAAASTYAEGILEDLFNQWRNRMISTTSATDRVDGLTTDQLTAALTNPTSRLSAPEGLTLTDFRIVAADPYLKPMPLSSDRPKPEAGSASKLRQRLNYLGRATVQFGTRAGVDEVTLERGFVRGGRNLFDDFLFSTQQITEIHPGAPLYIDRCQINGDVYLAHNDLHLMDTFKFTGELERDYRSNDDRFLRPNPKYDPTKPENATTNPKMLGQSPTILNGGDADNWNSVSKPTPGPEQKLLDTPLEALDPAFMDDPTSNDNDSDGNPNNDGFHELLEPRDSDLSKSDPLKVDTTTERMVEHADYRIFIDDTLDLKDPTKNVYNKVTIYEGDNILTSGSTYNAIAAALTTNRSINDTREDAFVRLATLDVEKIRRGVADGLITDRKNSDGLLMYVHDRSAGIKAPSTTVKTDGSIGAVSDVEKRGVRLVNGAKLPSISLGGGMIGGFSLVSPNAVYIQGDYNTGTKGTSTADKPASNTATSYTPPTDKPSPVVPGYSRVPSAVIGDSVNVLSNNWNDKNSTLGKASRVPANTTINTAIIAGNVPTTTSSYSGGIENFVRLHESWGGKYITIYGALALLYASKEATGKWNSADYDAANRRWFYDTLFHDQNPPGISAARSYDRGRWTSR